MLTEQVTAGGVTQRLYYLDGGAIYVKQDGQADQVYYACTDHLGSVVKLVDGAGTEVFAATYDAWGKQTITDSTFAYYRGYTGHEHLPEFDLINMSGRLYDPTLGRFLSCDPFVQMPDFSQNFNRYSYCLNNPLKYNDPSGEFFWIPLIAAIAVNGMQQGAEAQMNGKSFLSGAWKGAAVGAATSLVPYGVGQVFGHSVGSLGNELLRAGAHGLGNGLLNMAEGGKFGSGFLTGVAASFAGSAAQHFKFSSMGIVGSTTLAGAGASALFGGDWMAGAMQGMNIGANNFDGKGTLEDPQRIPEIVVLGERGWLNDLQTGIDVAGIADPTGLADLGNGLIYAFRGQWGNALISAAGIIPYVGDLGKAGRLGTKVFRAAKGGLTNAQLVKKSATLAERAIEGTGGVAGTAKHAYAKNLLSRYQSIYGDRGLSLGSNYFKGPAGKGFLDVVNHNTMTIYDFKFGNAVMSNAQYLKYSNSFSGYSIQIIRP